MYYYNPYAYNPFVNQGIFGIGSVPGRAGFYDLTGYNPYLRPTSSVIGTPVTPNPVANVGQSTEAINNQLATASSNLNTATQLNNAAAEKTEDGVEDGADEKVQGHGILPWVGVSLYGLNTLGNLYLGWRALEQAREQFNFQRDLANQNLAAAIQNYNTAQRERLRGRGYTEEEVDRMMKEQNRELKDTRKRK